MNEDIDLLVLGGNPGGCAAAVTAARHGLRVVLLEPTATLGGHNANGVFAFDAGHPSVLGPLANEFATLVRAHYADDPLSDDPVLRSRDDQVWESQVAAEVWSALCERTPGLTVIRGAVPVGAVREGRRVTRVSWEAAVTPSGDLPGSPGEIHEVHARYVVDASYEGDLLEWADIPYRIGREPRSRAEPHAGRIYFNDLDGGPGPLPPQSILPMSTGEADDAVMAFAVRLHCRWYDDPAPGAAHRVRAPSAGYDPGRYRWEPTGSDADGSPLWFTGITLLVGDKVVLSRTVAGNERAAGAREYMLAHPRDRLPLRRLFIDHALDFLYYVQNEGGCPLLGLAGDEFPDNDHVPYRMYAREGRRLRGAVTLDESDLSPFLRGDAIRPAPQPDVVAVGDWAIESRACADTFEYGHPYPEGWFFDRFSRAPHQIPFGAMIVPGIDNVIVCGPISATHLAFSATRVESTRINLGTAAGLAVALAHPGGMAAADLDVRSVQNALVDLGVPLTVFTDVPFGHPGAHEIQAAALRGWVPRDERWRFQPDRTVTWEELVTAAVAVLDVPRSVTGCHFVHVGRHHPAFVAFESLYDLATRHGCDLFGWSRSGTRQPVADLLRAARPATGLELRPDDEVPVTDAARLLSSVRRLRAARPAERVEAPALLPSTEKELLTRRALAALLNDTV